MKRLSAVLIILIISVALFAEGVITVNFGGAFGLVSAKNPHSATNKPVDVESNILTDYDRTLESATGLGFDVGMDFKLSSDYNMYLDFAMTFPFSLTIGQNKYVLNELEIFYHDTTKDYEDADFTSIDGGPFLNNLAFHVGFSKNIDLNSESFALKLGCGLGYERIKSGFRFTARKTEEENTQYYCYDEFEVLAHISFDIYAAASYRINDNFSVGITLMPGATFYSSSKFYATMKGSNLEPIPSSEYYGNDEEKSGMKPKYENSGFAFGFNLGVRLGASYTF